MADLGDTILQSIQVIVDKAIEGLSYDKTVVCNIIDASNAKRGEYTVDDGATTFVAYSDNTDYSVNTNVYVTIPNGDYSKQKMITGKYIADRNEYYTYQAPWKRFVDITGNISNATSGSILANGREHEIELGTLNIIDGSNYTCIGVKADFMAWLASFNTNYGEYGLNLYITTSEQSTTQTEPVLRTRLAKFSNLDMYGNTYSFETFYNQQKILAIGDLNNIVSVRICLFQNGNFKDINGNMIPYCDEEGRDLPNNIFVKDIYCAFGYDINDFNGDEVLLYTLDPLTYDATTEPVAKNYKTAKVRWIKYADNGNLEVVSDSSQLDKDIAVHWYKYRLANGVSDDLAGAFWEEIPEYKDTLEQILKPDITIQEEKYKVIIETPVGIYLKELADQDPNIAQLIEQVNRLSTNYQTAVYNYERDSSDVNKTRMDNAKAQLDEAEVNYNNAMAYYNSQAQLYTSNILIFTNESIVANKATVDLVQGLTINVDPDGYKGIYTLYDETNNIQNSTEANKVRQLIAEYKSILTGEENLDTAESITWQIPLVNTMIYPPEDGKEYSTAAGDEYSVSADGRYALITRNGKLQSGDIGSSFLNADKQNFRIKSYYTESATANTVFCYVIKNNITYAASAELVFGPRGTNGTDYTFILRMETDRTCLYTGEEDIVRINAALFDYNNLEIPNADGQSIVYSWFSKDDVDSKVVFCNETGQSTLGVDRYEPAVNLVNGNHMHCYVKLRNTNDPANYAILQATVQIDHEKLGKVLLRAFLPIPVCDNRKCTQIAGTTKIIYDANGTKPYYYKGKYQMYNMAEELVNDRWSIQTAAEQTARSFYPTIQDNHESIIVPTTFSIGTDRRVAAIGEVTVNGRKITWRQPILIMQNAYSSAFLNAWDGTYTVDEEAGTIMATMLGAGHKDVENRYNGVLIGDVKKVADAAADTGIYGYHEGVQSFGFNIDGTAFLGRSGKGQIQFDGNSGAIQSMSYNTNSSGMKIDLDDGWIDIRGAKLERIIKNGNTEQSVTTCLYDKRASNVTEIQKIDKALEPDSLALTNYGNNEEAYIELRQKSRAFLENQNAAIDYILGNCPLSNSEYSLFEDEETEQHIRQAYGISSLTALFNGTDYLPIYRSLNSRVKISATNPYFSIKSNTDRNTELIRISDKDYFLQTDDFQLEGQDKIGTGVKIDLGNGKITAYNFSILAKNTIETDPHNGSFLQMNSNGTPYLKVYYVDSGSSTAVSGVDLLNISNSQFKLHSQNWQAGQHGMEIDLTAGKFRSYDNFELKAVQAASQYLTGTDVNASEQDSLTDQYAGSYLHLKSDGSPFFQIHYVNNHTGIIQDLAKINRNEFVFRSHSWQDTPEDEHGMEIDIARGKITAYDNFKLYTKLSNVAMIDDVALDTNAEAEDEIYRSSYMKIQSDGKPFFQIHLANSAKKPAGTDLIKITNKDFQLSSHTWDAADKHGMQIDLVAGKITAYDNFDLNAIIGSDPIYNGEILDTGEEDNVIESYKGSGIRVSSNPNHFFNIHYTKTQGGVEIANVDLININKNTFVMRSPSWDSTNGHGMEIDLHKGKITAYDNFKLYATISDISSVNGVALDTNKDTGLVVPQHDYSGSFIKLFSDGNPFFQVHFKDYYATGASAPISYDIDLMKISRSEFFLQSKTYSPPDTSEGSTNHGKGTRFDVNGGTLEFRSVALSNKGYVKMMGNGNPYLEIHGTNQVLMRISTATIDSPSKYYLQSDNYVLDSASQPGQGVFFDLDNGKLIGYDFNLLAKKANGNYVLIDSGAADNGYPFIVDGTIQDSTNGFKFTIGWDGKVTANYLDAKVGGKIGPFKIKSDSLVKISDAHPAEQFEQAYVYLGDAGISVGSNQLANQFSANSSNGNVKIAGNLYISGTLYGNGWCVKPLQGAEFFNEVGDTALTATFQNVNAKSGKIGPWTLDNTGIFDQDTINSSNTVIQPDGIIKLKAQDSNSSRYTTLNCNQGFTLCCYDGTDLKSRVKMTNSYSQFLFGPNDTSDGQTTVLDMRSNQFSFRANPRNFIGMRNNSFVVAIQEDTNYSYATYSKWTNGTMISAWSEGNLPLKCGIYTDSTLGLWAMNKDTRFLMDVDDGVSTISQIAENGSMVIGRSKLSLRYGSSRYIEISSDSIFMNAGDEKSGTIGQLAFKDRVEVTAGNFNIGGTTYSATMGSVSGNTATINKSGGPTLYKTNGTRNISVDYSHYCITGASVNALGQISYTYGYESGTTTATITDYESVSLSATVTVEPKNNTSS